MRNILLHKIEIPYILLVKVAFFYHEGAFISEEIHPFPTTYNIATICVPVYSVAQSYPTICKPNGL